LGAVCEERNVKSSFCYYLEGEKNLGILKDQVENQPEYWEEIDNRYYLVFTKEETSFNAWEPINISDIKHDTDTRKYFSSKDEAKSFIIHNKPCLSFNEVKGLVGHGFFGSTSHQKLFELVKSRI
jgi:hypothetical protein